MESTSSSSAGTSHGVKRHIDEYLAVPGSSTSTSSVIPRRELLDGTFFEYLPQESTAHDVTALCKMCSPMSVKIKGPDECSFSFLRHLKRKHGENCVNQYKKYIKRKKDDMELKKNNTNSEEVRKVVSEEQLKKNIVDFIVGTMIPMEYIDNSYFFSFLENFNISKKHLETLSYEKYERYLDEEFEIQMKQIKAKIGSANFVCSSIDVWKRKGKQYLSATAHWFTDDLTRISVALACKEYKGVPPYGDVKQLFDPIFTEFSLCADVERVSAIFIEDCRAFIRGFNAYGVQNQSIECKDPSSLYEILSEPSNTATTGSLLIWIREENVDDYLVIPDVIDCSGRTLRLTATIDFIHIINTAPNKLFLIHEAALKKCNYLWTAAGFKTSSKDIVDILGHNLIRPNENRWNSLYDAFRQILTLKPKNHELHAALGLQHVITDQEFKYIEEHLRSAMPLAEAVDLLMSKNNNYYGTVLPCLITLINQLKEMEEKSDMIYCNHLVKGFRNSVETRFKDVIDLSNIESEHAAIAAISCPRYKNKWLSGVESQERCGIVNIFEALLTRAFNAEREQSELLINNNNEEEFLGLGNSEMVYVPKPNNSFAISNAEMLMLRYFDDKREDLEMLERYPEIKKIFFEYNAPLASAVSVNTIFDSEEIMRLTKTNELEGEALFKRVIMKYNLESMKYLRKNE